MNEEAKIDNKKTKRKIAAVIAMTVVCVLLGAVVAVQYKSLSSTNNIITTDADKINSLQEQLIKLDRENEVLINENTKLENQVEVLEDSTNEEQIEQLASELNKVKTFAGATKVSGSGLYISIKINDNILSNTLQRHLLSLINELKSCTAQAISINGERITAMTETRVVGDYVIINGRQYQAPFTIYAIGKPQEMLNGILLNGNGPLAILDKEAACDVEYQIQDNIIIEACKSADIITNLLKNIE